MRSFITFRSYKRAFNFRFFRLTFCNVTCFCGIQAAKNDSRCARDTFVIVRRFVTYKILMNFLCANSIARTGLIIVISLGRRFSSVFCNFRFIICYSTSAIFAVFVVSYVNNFILTIRNYRCFYEFGARIYRAILRRKSVSTFKAFTMRFRAICPFRFIRFPFCRFNVIKRFAIKRSIAYRNVRRTVCVSRIVFSCQNNNSFKRRNTNITCFTTRRIPTLFRIVIQRNTRRFCLCRKRIIM